MPTIKNLNEDYYSIKNLGAMITALEEVSVMKMQKNRQHVLETRNFMDGLLSIFTDLKTSHQREVEQAFEPKHWWWQIKLKPKKNPESEIKKLAVLLSPNKRLTGPLVHEVFHQYSEFLVKNSADHMVVGSVGKSLYQNKFGREPRWFFQIDEEKFQTSEIDPFLQTVNQYQEVTVFNAHFQTLMTQTPMMTPVTAHANLQNISTKSEPLSKNDGVVINFLFEPQLPNLLNFFQSQVQANLVKQTLHESHLAHLGSQVTSLEKSSQAIELEEAKLYHKLHTAKRMQDHRRQLSRLAGYQLCHH